MTPNWQTVKRQCFEIYLIWVVLHNFSVCLAHERGPQDNKDPAKSLCCAVALSLLLRVSSVSLSSSSRVQSLNSNSTHPASSPALPLLARMRCNLIGRQWYTAKEIHKWINLETDDKKNIREVKVRCLFSFYFFDSVLT